MSVGLPNMRLKLTGASKEGRIPFVCPDELRSTHELPVRLLAQRPQLKRDPLGAGQSRAA